MDSFDKWFVLNKWTLEKDFIRANRDAFLRFCHGRYDEVKQ